MRSRQNLILSLTAVVVLVLLAPGSWARADESTTQHSDFGIESFCLAEADCYCYPCVISCEGDSTCSAKDEDENDLGFVQCDGGNPTYCSDKWTSLTVSVPEVIDCEPQGSASLYTLRATATGNGCGSYYFSWANATSSDPDQNPNYATSLIYHRPIGVHASATSECRSVSGPPILLEPDCASCCP